MLSKVLIHRYARAQTRRGKIVEGQRLLIDDVRTL